MKHCKRCDQTKPFSEFYPRRDGKENTIGGYIYLCKLCDNKKSIERRKAGGWIYEKARQKQGSKHAKLSKKNSQKHRDECSDMYIRGLITKKDKHLKPEDIPIELVEAWRINLLLKRQLRKLKD